jgi:integrase
MAPPPDARTRKGKSARKGFATLDVNWREILVQHAGKNSRLPMAVMAISGIRPSELELGVELTEAPDDTLAVRVQGTKVSKGKGQKTRTLFFRTDQSSMIRWIVSCVKQAGGLLRVGRKPRQLRKDVAAASKRASYKLLKPYSFRHAVASDLKASDTDKVDLAAVLGHQSTATQKKYGKKSLSKRGTTSLVRVNYSTPIRTPDRPHPASSARTTVNIRTLVDNFTP